MTFAGLCVYVALIFMVFAALLAGVAICGLIVADRSERVDNPFEEHWPEYDY